MGSELSHGLPALATSGPAIVDAVSGRPVRLQGVNLSGLEYAEPVGTSFLEGARISEAAIDAIVRGWGANVIRLPFNQDWALHGRGGVTPESYLAALDQAILWASRAGAYTLLDLQWLDADGVRGLNADGSINRVPALPDADSIGLWSMLADRYRDEPAVLFDVFNEPHHPMPDDPSALRGITEDGTLFPLEHRRVTMAEWQPWARHLVRAIRDVHPESVVFVSGVRWAYDLRGMPLTVSSSSSELFENVVYSTHVYPWCGHPTRAARWGHSPFAPRLAPCWGDAFGRLARGVPVFVAEWGGESPHLHWGETLVRYLRRLDVGWAAWSWSDYPRLVANAQAGAYEPTEFGDLVRRALLRSGAQTGETGV